MQSFTASMDMSASSRMEVDDFVPNATAIVKGRSAPGDFFGDPQSKPQPIRARTRARGNDRHTALR